MSTLSIFVMPLRRKLLALVVSSLVVAAPLVSQGIAPPFAVGEVAEYRAGWGIFGSAGKGTLTLTRDTVRGGSALHAVLAIRGGIPGFRINERLESWMRPTDLAALRFLQHTRYPSFSRDRDREFFPDERRWSGQTNQKPETGELPTSRPLDELGFIFVARSAKLVVGEELTFGDYWKVDGNPVRLKVLRRETVKVPAGTFNTIVVQPIIKSGGLFAEKGEAEVYISDGPAHELVMLRAKMSIGTLVLQLERFKPGLRNVD